MPNNLAPAQPTSPSPATPRLSTPSTVLIVLCGIVMPAITNLVEALLHMCADGFFDPLPTVGHVFAIATVPLANGFSLWALNRRDGAHLDAVIFAQAFAVAVSAVYALMFVPITPLAVVAILFFGLGLLPLTPALSLIASLRALLALRKLRECVSEARLRRAELDAGGVGNPPRVPMTNALALPARRMAWAGLAAGVGTLMALSLPPTLTRAMLVRAASDDPATSRSGITWLRRVGQRDLMVRAATGRAHGAFDLLGAGLDVVAPIPYDKTREIYYRVTGRPIETEPLPRLGGNPLSFNRRDDWDVNQGGDQVGVVALRGLSLASSRFDGSVDARAAVAYVEWTFELKNVAPMQREARAELALPPGGVVSRVTLWIDGVEREAVVAGRDATRRAYERVVRVRRDPILVTTSAPDRILVQCFPVQPNGGVMKARIGITAPLQLANRTSGTLGLPYFTQRNFEVPAGVTHAVWIASKDAFAAPTPPLVRDRVAGGEEVRGKLAEPRSPTPFAAVTVERPPAVTTAWTPERLGNGAATSDAIIRQTLQAATPQAPSRLVVVVDGMGAMKEAGPVLAAALRALPAGIPVAIEVASDDVVDLLGGVVPNADPAGNGKLAARLGAVDFAGGTDSLPALAAAWELAAAAPRGAVLWIHGPQPVLIAPTDEVRQRMERRRDGPVIYTYAAMGGENRLLANLGDLPNFKAVPRYLPGSADLEWFLRGLGGREERITAVRTRETNVDPAALGGVETSDHLARLWASERIDALLHPASGKPPAAADRKQALALAARYRLVTPVSGAVVLDSQAEMDALAGSDPNQQVPTVPEPETWALLALIALLLLYAVHARRRLAPSGTLHASQ